jgi:hypothetical protein
MAFGVGVGIQGSKFKVQRSKFKVRGSRFLLRLRRGGR